MHPINCTSERRNFLKKIILAGAGLLIGNKKVHAHVPIKKHTEETRCTVYRAVNGTAQNNLAKVIELMGGIEKLFGSDDIIIIKPNLQWWNQGAPNLAALKTFIELIMERQGGFKGEVIIAENCHRGQDPWNRAGWAHPFEWNSDIPNIHNMNELSRLLKKKYGDRFSISHWIDVDDGNKRVYSPTDGTGYVYCDGSGNTPLISLNNGAAGPDYRATIMTYPIFKTDKETIVDLKNGIWKNGAYTKQPLRYVNFSALNHHSTYCGFTSAVKNYLGVSDISGDADPHNGGMLTDKYYNFHSFPFNKWSPGPTPGMLGAEIGVFLDTIRRADLHITTAEWIGLSSRTDHPLAHTKTILACTDPVALDYHAGKYILYPNSRIPVHNPDDSNSPAYEYLTSCAEHGGGICDERYVGVDSFDFEQKKMQKDDKLVIIGKKHWGLNIKHLMKYFVFRFGV